MGVTSAVLAPSQGTVVRWSWALLVANAFIVLTGGLVRLTGSGLGCPTWPRCTDGSFVPHRALGIHGAIEFGNRMITYVLVAVAICTAVAIWRHVGSSRDARRLVVALVLGVPFQGVIGGITVLTDLNPWIVSLHLLLSLLLIAGSVVLLRLVRGDRAVEVSATAVRLVRAVMVVLVVVLYLGTVVTGSGPHAGDADSPRNGIDPQLMSHVHAAAVYLLVALTIATVIVLRDSPALPAAVLLLGVELLQGAIGFVQYFTGLPEAVVAAHILGAAVLVATGTRLLLLVTRTSDVPVGTMSAG